MIGDYQVYNTYGPANDTTHGYRVTLSADKVYWVGSVDGAQIAAYPTQLDSADYFFSGQIAEYYEELTSGQKQAQNSAFAGTISNHARFSNIRAFFNNTTYYSPTADAYSVLDTNGAQDISTTHYSSTITNQSLSYIDLWDIRYN